MLKRVVLGVELHLANFFDFEVKICLIMSLMSTPCVKLAESIIIVTKVTQQALISYYTRVNLKPNTECKEKNLN